jgi:electron transport complex protein RnfD
MLTISPSPHDHSGESVSKLMFGVIIAMIPAFIVSVIYYGAGALVITVTAMLSC